MTAQITKRAINSAIKRAGLTVIIENNRDGYSYFTSTETGNQVGESVCLCYLNEQSIDQWVEDARYAIDQDQQTKSYVRKFSRCEDAPCCGCCD